MTKVDWFASGVLAIPIPSSAGLVYEKKVKWNLQPFPDKGKQGLADLTNKKQENGEKIQADKILKRSGIRFSKAVAPEKFKNRPRPLPFRPRSIYACQQNPTPSRDLVL
jgi:hypothetical protein